MVFERTIELFGFADGAKRIHPALGIMGETAAQQFPSVADSLYGPGVIAVKLLFQSSAYALCHCGAFTVGGNGNLEMALCQGGGGKEAAVLGNIHNIAEDISFLALVPNQFIHSGIIG